MSKITTGRKIGQDGQPIEGTGFEYNSEDRLAKLLKKRTSPLISNPITGEWIFGLIAAEDTNGEYEEGVVIFKPGNLGPPEHFHPTYDEYFEVIQGTFIFNISGKEQQAEVGTKLLVKKGVPHSFRCVSDDYGVVIGGSRPCADVGDVISTLFGMAHEGLLGTKGQPKLLQGMVLGSHFADNTVFTSPPPSIAIPIAKALAPIGRLLGHRPTYPKYTEDSFWNSHVEQPK